LSIAEKLGLTLRLRNEGSQSSTIGYRDVLEELKEDISKGRVKNIWTQDKSRMFRDQIEGLMFRRDYLEKHKVTLYEGEIPTKVDFSNIQDKMVYDLITRLQQYDNELRTEKFQRGKLHRLKLHSTDKKLLSLMLLLQPFI
jgi:DNA invertase Pin-like site-specific DNA recombinase